jgi:hypothetical protein
LEKKKLPIINGSLQVQQIILYSSFELTTWAPHCYALPVTINYFILFYFYVFMWFSIIHHYLCQCRNLILSNIHFMAMKRHMLIWFFSSPCWWIVIKWDSYKMEVVFGKGGIILIKKVNWKMKYFLKKK